VSVEKSRRNSAGKPFQLDLVKVTRSPPTETFDPLFDLEIYFSHINIVIVSETDIFRAWEVIVF
jgi:hypothetical protein